MSVEALRGTGQLPGADRARRRTPNLAHALTQAARRNPGGTAVVRGELRWTWAEFDDRVDALTVGLQDRGVGPGSVVLSHSPNTEDLLTVMYAVWRAGGVWAPTNFRIDPDDVAGLAEQTDPDLLVCHRDFPMHAAAVSHLPTLMLDDVEPAPMHTAGRRFGEGSIHDLIAVHRGRRPRVHLPRADEHVWYFFTSGSSGRPKIAVLTHDQMQFVVTSHLCDLMPDLRADDGTLVVAPLSHGAGIHVTTHIARGAKIVLPPGNGFSPELAWRLVEAERVSTMFTVPTILTRLTQDETLHRVDHTSLRYVIYAGAPISRKDLKAALGRLGPVLVQYYGLGEVTGNITVLPTWMHDEEADAEGIPPAGIERTGMQISIQDPAGRELAPGQRGEICVCGPAVFAGYLNNPAANAKAFRDGWFRTGDLGHLDDRGMLYITGRDSDMYISGGSNIDPREVEEKILKHPDVAQAGVIGVPDPEWGEIGYAVCVMRPDVVVDPDVLLAWCRDNMPRYKAPKRVLVVDALPTSGYGKITKNLLRDLLIATGQWPDTTDAGAPR